MQTSRLKTNTHLLFGQETGQEKREHEQNRQPTGVNRCAGRWKTGVSDWQVLNC